MSMAFGEGAALLRIPECWSGAQLGEGTARGPWEQPGVLESPGNSACGSHRVGRNKPPGLCVSHMLVT